jgi:PAS domain S-box-containing protein
MDARGFVLDANPAFCRQIGFSREELLGAHVSRFSTDSIETIDRHITRLMSGEVLEHQVTNSHRDGGTRHYELRETAITMPDGTRGILALATDITDRLRDQEARLEMERQLLHADKLKSLGLLAGGIAHDFNNLLTAIIGNLELAMMDAPRDAVVQGELMAASAATQRAADLTRQMLAYSGRGRFVISDVDLSSLVGEMAELLDASISKKATLRLHLAPEVPFVAADGPQLQQVVMNLVTNASDALMDRPGRITVTTGVRECDAETLSHSPEAHSLAAGPYVVLEVCDNGCGMDESVKDRLFDPFFTTKFTGRGLGMSAVLGVVRGHKGGILVSSQPGRGTTISVLFPARGEARACVVPQTKPPREMSPRAEPMLSGTVLVVDDEPPLRLLFERTLTRMGLRVLTAADGEEAVACFQKHADEISFVILDLTMPKLDGVKTLAELRRHRPQVKAVLSSGYDVESANPQYLQEGFAAFIRKPFQLEALIALVRRLCAEDPA